jgi:PBP1b-binding outer membrane lipoprotein LpoB
MPLPSKWAILCVLSVLSILTLTGCSNEPKEEVKPNTPTAGTGTTAAQPMPGNRPATAQGEGQAKPQFAPIE